MWICQSSFPTYEAVVATFQCRKPYEGDLEVRNLTNRGLVWPSPTCEAVIARFLLKKLYKGGLEVINLMNIRG